MNSTSQQESRSFGQVSADGVGAASSSLGSSVHPEAFRDGPDKRKIGRRGASRLKIHLPACLETISARLVAAIADLSQTGAGLRLEAAPRLGADVVLTFGEVEAFAKVVWTKDGLVGLEFYSSLSLQQVLAARLEAEILSSTQQQQLSHVGEDWSLGTHH